MPLPIAPVTLPLDLNGQQNGRLDPELLVDIPGGGQLHHTAARAWLALVAAAWVAVELPLTFTYGGTYRDYAGQVALFRSRYAVGATGGGCKRWLQELWCKIRSAFATAATPGTSNHGLGIAIDTAFDKDLTNGIGPGDAAYIASHPGWQWLLEHAHLYGFSWELQSEPWHLRYVTGDSIPAAVLAYEASLTPAPTPPKPEPAPLPEPDPEGDDDVMKAIYYPGDEIKHLTDVHFAAFASGIVRHASGPDTDETAWPNVPRVGIHGVDHFNQLARMANHMSGAQIELIG